MHEESERFLGPAARHAIAARVRRGKEEGTLPGWCLLGSGEGWGPGELAGVISLIEQGITSSEPRWGLSVLRGDDEDPRDYIVFALKTGEETPVESYYWLLSFVPRGLHISEETRISIANLIEQGYSQGENPQWLLSATSVRE